MQCGASLCGLWLSHEYSVPRALPGDCPLYLEPLPAPADLGQRLIRGFGEALSGRTTVWGVSLVSSE